MKAAIETFTPNDLAKILNLHPFTVTRLAREGKIPAFKVGGVWRIRKDEFERWIEQQGRDRGSRHKQRGATSDHSN
jgi:excisionase family DNA binding protein